MKGKKLKDRHFDDNQCTQKPDSASGLSPKKFAIAPNDPMT
jgi:hypothetical protein